MHLVMFRTGDRPRLGVLVDGEASTALVDLHRGDPGLPADMMALLAGGDSAMAVLRAALSELPATARLALADVELLAPVPSPSKIIGVGLNYREHAEETGSEIPTYPTVFAKFPTSIIGPGADIAYPKASARVDYEGELGVVIGRRCREVSEADARTYIAGYLNINDVTARDVQNCTSQWTLGKSFDTFAPIGPALVTADEVPDPQDLKLTVRVNGETRQHSNTNQMIFSVDRLVSELSAVCTLEPGDIIATGTPSGVGIGFDPERLLAVGDVVEVHIAGLGVLRNRVSEPTNTHPTH